MDIEKNHFKEETGGSIFYILVQEPLTDFSRIADVTESASSSEPSLELKPKAIDFKPNPDILPEKTGTRITRYLQCKFSSPLADALS